MVLTTKRRKTLNSHHYNKLILWLVTDRSRQNRVNIHLHPSAIVTMCEILLSALWDMRPPFGAQRVRRSQGCNGGAKPGSWRGDSLYSVEFTYNHAICTLQVPKDAAHVVNPRQFTLMAGMTRALAKIWENCLGLVHRWSRRVSH